ncbi:MAG: phosphotransferase [Caulobacterales bacterium]
MSNAAPRFDDDIAALLTLAIRDLEGVVLPAVPSSSAAFTGDIIVKLLRLIADRLATPDLVDDEIAATRDVARALGLTLDKNATTNVDDVQTPLGEAARRWIQSGADLPWPTVLKAAESREKRQQGGVSRSLTESFAEAGAGGAKSRQGAAGDPKRLTVEALQRILDARGSAKSARVTSLKEIGSGSQKTIFLATFDDAEKTQWVLRQDKNFSSFGLTVADEVPYLAQLTGADIPAPKALWLHPADQDVHAFYANEPIPGSANFVEWSQSEHAEEIAAQIATVMARLHAIPKWSETRRGPHLPGAHGDTPRDRVAHMRQYWDAIGARPVALIDACFAWCEQNAPAGFDREVPVHGDFAFHNIMVEDGRMTGLLDWEFAHFGDPHEDMDYIRPFMERMTSWRNFTDAYARAGGVRYQPKLGHWWGVLGMLRLAVGCHFNLEVIRGGRSDIDIRVANQGYLYAGQLLLDTARLIAAGPRD